MLPDSTGPETPKVSKPNAQLLHALSKFQNQSGGCQSAWTDTISEVRLISSAQREAETQHALHVLVRNTDPGLLLTAVLHNALPAAKATELSWDSEYKKEHHSRVGSTAQGSNEMTASCT